MEKKTINYSEPDPITILYDDSLESHISNAAFQEIEELDDTVPSNLTERIPLSRRSTIWDSDDLPRRFPWPVGIAPFQSQRSSVITPQAGEEDYQWFCITEKVAPHSRVSSHVRIYWYWVEKPKSFLPDFYGIRNITKTLFASAHTEFPGDIPSILAVSETRQVIKEAKAEKIVKDLEVTIELIRTIYSTLKEIKLDVKYDPEITDRKTFCFTLTVSGDIDVILKNESSFKKELLSIISYHARELIVITYNWEK